MHGADNLPKALKTKHAAAAGATRAVHAKAVTKDALTRPSASGAVKTGKVNEIKKPDDAPAGCASWWSF